MFNFIDNFLKSSFMQQINSNEALKNAFQMHNEGQANRNVGFNPFAAGDDSNISGSAQAVSFAGGPIPVASLDDPFASAGTGLPTDEPKGALFLDDELFSDELFTGTKSAQTNVPSAQMDVSADQASSSAVKSSAELPSAPAVQAENLKSTSTSASSSSSVPKFFMTSASKYDEGSDVRQMAAMMEGAENISDVDFSKYTVLKGNSSDNNILISQNKNGIKVTVDGQSKTFSLTEAKKLIIDGGYGNDRIVCDSSVTANLHIVGGKGNDKIVMGKGNDTVIDNYGANDISGNAGNDTIIANQKDYLWYSKTNTGNKLDGGAGNDYIEGGKGHDTINGGSGDDVIYGMDGNDKITGSIGSDYIDGGAGSDNINAGIGNDMVFGGKGNDTIDGGSGKDVIVGGAGKDTVKGGSGADKIYTEGKDKITSDSIDTVKTVKIASVPKNISISGDDSFKARVTSDLEALAATPLGQDLMKSIAATGHTVTIGSTNGGNYCAFDTTAYVKSNGKANSGSNSDIAYNRSLIDVGSASWSKRPAIVGLYHEMVHSYDAAKGLLDGYAYNYNGTRATGRNGDNGQVLGAELQAVGININSDKLKMNPANFSENAMRSFLGLTQRLKY
ncbi:hypothetical protein IJT93_08345 [bacterium]|nr:hypothetical protein [bacterium]